MACQNWRKLLLIAVIIQAISGPCVALDLQNVLVVETPKKNEEPSKLTIVHKPDSVSMVKEIQSIPAHDISPVITLALGLTPTQGVHWKGLRVGNIFKRPSANVLIAVTDVPIDNKFGIDHSYTSYRVDESAKTVTGNAFLDMVHGPNKENVATYVSNVFEKKPLTVSISASYEVAQAGFGNQGKSFSVFLDGLDEKFHVASPSDDHLFDSLSASKEATLKEFEKFNFGKGMRELLYELALHPLVIKMYLITDVHFNVEKKLMIVTLPDDKKIPFDMNKRSDYIFFAEIFTMLKSLEIIKANKDLIHDDAPDVYTYSISSIKALDMEHGKDSNQVHAAIRVLHHVVPKIYKSFNEMYDGEALIELLSRGSSGRLVFERPEQAKKMYEHVKPHLHVQHEQDFRHRLPFIHLKKNLGTNMVNGICHSLNGLLNLFGSKAKIDCHGQSSDARVGRSLMAAATTNSPLTEKNFLKRLNISPVYTSDYPVIFNIILWLMIILAIGLYVTAAVMWDMDPGRDSIIYRMTSQRIKTD
ncbi:Renin receptor [Trichoplax sp. H2]|nr:Renin receptor [Trichoplax sp. H2]|eukprot:RDD40910.1 Renin receptor [Trichoplax sp. H2]